MDRAQLDSVMEKNPFSSLNDAVYEVLLEEILNFKLLPGSMIIERKIADALGVSRSPVKTAIEKLIRNDYITVISGKYHVASLSLEECCSIMDIAILIESYAAAEAAEKKTTEQIQTLSAMAKRLQVLFKALLESEQKPRYQDVMDADMNFHSYIVKMADNKLLSQIYDETKYKLMRYRNYIIFSKSTGALAAVENDHMNLCKMIDMGDRDVAAAGAKHHLLITRNEFLKNDIFENLMNLTKSSE